MKVLGIVGSLRKNSYNRALMHAFVETKPEGVDFEITDISQVPFYNEDVESTFPESVQALKDQIVAADLIIIATPEYNRSIPGILKNAIDWVSRPRGKNSFFAKKVFIMSASTGAIGGAVAQCDLKKILMHGNAHVFPQPEFYVGMAESKFDTEGNVIDEKTKESIKNAWARIIE